MPITIDSWQAYLLFAVIAAVPFFFYAVWLRRRARQRKNARLLDTVYDKQERRRRGE